MLELHCHTTFSDGILTPQELVALAKDSGVRALAITDHDTLGGWDQAIAAGEVAQIEIIPGVELSTVYNGRSLHILGYYPQRELIEQPLTERLAGRKRRAARMVENLAEMGYPIEIPNLSGNMALGRPHIASAMVKAGHVGSTQEAFTRFIGEDCPAYVHYEKFSTQAGIQLIKDCGGVPVWAHPYLFRGGKVAEVLPELVAAGLVGIEAYHPNFSNRQQQDLLSYCQEYRLLVTGGTDYHGTTTGKKARTQLNYFQLPLTLLTELKQAVDSSHTK